MDEDFARHIKEQFESWKGVGIVVGHVGSGNRLSEIVEAMNCRMITECSEEIEKFKSEILELRDNFQKICDNNFKQIKLDFDMSQIIFDREALKDLISGNVIGFSIGFKESVPEKVTDIDDLMNFRNIIKAYNSETDISRKGKNKFRKSNFWEGKE